MIYFYENIQTSLKKLVVGRKQTVTITAVASYTDRYMQSIRTTIIVEHNVKYRTCLRLCFGCLYIHNTHSNIVLLFHHRGIIRCSLCQHPVESVLTCCTRERPGNWNSHFNYSDIAAEQSACSGGLANHTYSITPTIHVVWNI